MQGVQARPTQVDDPTSRIAPRSTLLSWRSIAQMLLACVASGASRSLRISSVAAFSQVSAALIDATGARRACASSALAYHAQTAAATGAHASSRSAYLASASADSERSSVAGDGSVCSVSDDSARHSHDIRSNPAAAIVIYQTDPTDALYITARAAELDENAEILRAIHVLQRKPQPERWVVGDVADVTNASPWRIYGAIPERIEVRDETVKNGKVVVVREPTALSRGGSA